MHCIICKQTYLQSNKKFANKFFKLFLILILFLYGDIHNICSLLKNFKTNMYYENEFKIRGFEFSEVVLFIVVIFYACS